MADTLLLFFFAVALMASGYVAHRWGIKPALGALAGFAAIGLALFRRAAPTPMPPPPSAAGTSARVATEATAVVAEKATTEREAIAKAADDPDALAAAMRNQR